MVGDHLSCPCFFFYDRISRKVFELILFSITKSQEAVCTVLTEVREPISDDFLPNQSEDTDWFMIPIYHTNITNTEELLALILSQI